MIFGKDVKDFDGFSRSTFSGLFTFLLSRQLILCLSQLLRKH